LLHTRRSAAAAGECGQYHVVSVRRKLKTNLFEVCNNRSAAVFDDCIEDTCATIAYLRLPTYRQIVANIS